jgi:DNA polymerase-3 subunit delta
MTIFFYGPNAYSIREQVNQMVAAYIKKTGSDLGVERIDGSAVTVQDLKSKLDAAPFLATSRLVVVNQVSVNKQVGAKLEAFLKGVPATTVAVFVEGEIDQRLLSFKALKGADKVLKVELLTGSRLRTWIQKQVQSLGGVIDPGTVGALIDKAGEDQWRLSNEIAKLVGYDKTVTLKTIDALVVPSPERSVFELVDAMTVGQAGRAVEVYRALLGQKQTAMYVLSMVQWQLRNLVIAKAAGNKTAGEVAKLFGMNEYAIAKAMGASKRLDEGRLKDAFGASADCEFDIKTGRVKPELAVERLIYRVASATS